MNCKKGDLAIIISAKIHFEGIGAIVSVLDVGPAIGEPTWYIGFQGKIPNGLDPRFPIWISDSQLRPVSGLPDAEHTDEREPIKELA